MSELDWTMLVNKKNVVGLKEPERISWRQMKKSSNRRQVG